MLEIILLKKKKKNNEMFDLMSIMVKNLSFNFNKQKTTKINLI